MWLLELAISFSVSRLWLGKSSHFNEEEEEDYTRGMSNYITCLYNNITHGYTLGVGQADQKTDYRHDVLLIIACLHSSKFAINCAQIDLSLYILYEVSGS